MHATAAAPSLPKLLDAIELEEALDRALSRQRIYELAREGKIPSVKIGRSVRFSVQAVAAWIEAGGTTGPDGAE